jgi:nicotinamidase-related amidase
MPFGNFPAHPVVHLDIDRQSVFLNDIDPQRAAKIICSVDSFSDWLHLQGIPTIHVVMSTFNSENLLVSALGADIPGRPHFLANIGFVGSYRDGDVFCFKENGSVTSNPLITDLFDAWGAEHVIVTGVCTGACIAASVGGILQSGRLCSVAMDLIADTEEEFDIQHNPLEHFEWHERELDYNIRQEYPDLSLAGLHRALSTDIVTLSKTRPVGHPAHSKMSKRRLAAAL